jgi:Uma2 family endonuclease
MPAATATLTPQPAYTNEPIYPLSVDQYHDLIDRAILTSDDPVELIEGMLVFKMPKNPPHAITTGLLSDLLQAILIAGWHLRIQEPVTLSDGEPEPDIAIVRGARRDHLSHHPGPADVALLIEIADATLERDRGLKLRSYARAAVACYWIVNLIDRQIEIFTDPDPDAKTPRYRRTTIFKPGDAVPLTLHGQAAPPIPVSEILPPA